VQVPAAKPLEVRDFPENAAMYGQELAAGAELESNILSQDFARFRGDSRN